MRRKARAPLPFHLPKRFVACAPPAVAVVAAAALCLTPAAAAKTHAAARTRGCAHAHARIATHRRAALQRAVVCLINRQRQARRLPRLIESTQLNRSAQGWSNTMVAFRSFSHGSDFAARISAVGFRWSRAGENIATGYDTPAGVVRAWMASAGHCANILNPTYRYVGTGVRDRGIAGFGSQPGTWTQDFGLLIGQRAPSGNWGPADGCPYD